MFHGQGSSLVCLSETIRGWRSLWIGLSNNKGTGCVCSCVGWSIAMFNGRCPFMGLLVRDSPGLAQFMDWLIL